MKDQTANTAQEGRKSASLPHHAKKQLSTEAEEETKLTPSQIRAR